MDDGSWTGSGLLLHTNSFSESEVDCLIAANKRNRYGKWIIYIPVKDVTLLRSIVFIYMPKSFYYKIGIKKSKKKKQMSLWGELLSAFLYNVVSPTYLVYINICCEPFFPFMDVFLWSIIPIKYSGKSNNKIKGILRIGPHSIEILSIIFGSLLGDAHGERRKSGAGTRFSFQQESSHVSYLLWLHELLAEAGYCNVNKPVIKTRLGKKGVVRKYVRFATWTYTSFNFIHDLWYPRGVKIVPECISDYLSPLALAIWIMDDGSKVSKGLKLCTNSFSYSDCLLLINVLNQIYGLKSSVHSAGAPEQYVIYIWTESMPRLRKIIEPHMHSSMKYKIIE